MTPNAPNAWKMIELMERDCYDADAAWRLAVETWLLDNGFITVSKKENVSPGFS